MSLELFDTHCHLNMAKHFPEPARAVAEAREAGVTRLAVVGIDVPTSRRALELAEAHEGVYAVVGMHPTSVGEFGSGVLREFEEMLAHPKAVALGEIGLDYHWDFTTPSQQDAALRAQLELAESLGVPVVFHCREANKALLELLEGRTVLQYLFHCFSGDASDASRALALGGYLGVDGPLTYKKAAELREVMRSAPRERVVVETDSPYLTPEPYRGKPNKPAYVVWVNRALSALWGVNEEEGARQTTENAMRFFRLA